METKLRTASQSLVGDLRTHGLRLVLAESCTGGLLASLLTEIAGVSEVFCGSQVVYREDSKRRWAGVRGATLAKKSAVSAEVASELAHGVLRKTPEAALAASITGYLGPTGEKVGRVYVATIRRGETKAQVHELDLRLRDRGGRTPEDKRRALRNLAAFAVLAALRAHLLQSQMADSSLKMKRGSN